MSPDKVREGWCPLCPLCWWREEALRRIERLDHTEKTPDRTQPAEG